MCPKVRSGYIPIIYILLITDKDLGLSTLTVYGNRELEQREEEKRKKKRLIYYESVVTHAVHIHIYIYKLYKIRDTMI